MIPIWLGISVFSAIILLAITIVVLLLYGKQSESKKRINLFRVMAFLLMFLLAIIIYIPMPDTYADGVITGRLIGNSVAYLLLGASFVLELLDIQKPKRARKSKK